MKLDNETKAWLDDLARAGCNQRDAANQLMYRVDNANIDTPSYTPLTYEHAVNLYKSARKRVRKSSTDESLAQPKLVMQFQIADTQTISKSDVGSQVYAHDHMTIRLTPKSSDDKPIGVLAGFDEQGHPVVNMSAAPKSSPIGILIPIEGHNTPQVGLEGPEQAPEAATPSQVTPSPSAALPEPPVKDLPASFHELFPGLNPSAAPPLSKYVSEVIANGEQEISTEKTQAPQVKNYRHALCDYIDSVAAGGERNPTIEEAYADDAELLDRLVSLLDSETQHKWDNGTLTHDQIVSFFKDAKIAHQLDEDDLEKAFWDFDTCRKRGSDRDAFKMVVRAALTQRGLFNSTSKPDIVLVNAQVEMVNGIRDLTEVVRALPIASVIAAKDETIAAKDAELETLREYVRHLQRQVGVS